MSRTKLKRRNTVARNDVIAGAPSELSEVEWDLALERFEALKPFIENGGTKEQIKLAGEKLGLKASRCRDLIKRLKKNPLPEAMVLRKTGRKEGSKCLSNDVEDVVQETIGWCLDQPESFTQAEIYNQIRLSCYKKKLEVPSIKAVNARLSVISEYEKKSRKFGKAVAEREHGQDASPIIANGPLDHVQIDHTKVDLLVVDSETGIEIGRPWLTLAIDVFTRAILGIYLSLEAPSAISLACCLANVICPKRDYLYSKEIYDTDWPMYGFPKRIHVDNGADMHSQAFRRGCQNLGIELTYRIPGQPHSGGIVERVFRTLMSRVHTVPGTTGSNSRARKNYKSEVRAYLTLWDIEKYIIHDVIRYHHSIHRGLKTAPQIKWQQNIDKYNLPRTSAGAKSRREIYATFLPSEVRKIRDGRIYFKGQEFIGEYLKAHSESRVRVYYHPQDCRSVYVQDKNGKVFDAVNFEPALCRVPLSYEEVRRARKNQSHIAKKSGATDIELACLESQSQVVSKSKQRHARRTADRRKHLDEQKVSYAEAVVKKMGRSSVDYDSEVQPYEVLK